MKIYEVKPGEKQTFTPSNTNKESSYYKFRTECSDSIAAMQAAGKFLFRGIRTGSTMGGGSKNPIPKIFIGKPREDRRPLDTDTDISSKFDELLIASGFKAIRSNTIFCSGHAATAGGYSGYSGGGLYLIFPKNGYSLTWSTKVNDFTNYLPYSMTVNEFYKYGKANEAIKALEKKSRDMLYEVHSKIYGISASTSYPGGEEFMIARKKAMNDYDEIYYNNNWKYLPNFIESAKIFEKLAKEFSVGGSPMFKGYSLPKNWEETLLLSSKIPELKKQAKENTTPQDIIAGLGFRQDDLAAALKSNNEILIGGEYYAFKSSLYEKALTKDILGTAKKAKK